MLFTAKYLLIYWVLMYICLGKKRKAGSDTAGSETSSTTVSVASKIASKLAKKTAAGKSISNAARSFTFDCSAENIKNISASLTKSNVQFNNLVQVVCYNCQVLSC
jgi:hypothetical protein